MEAHGDHRLAMLGAVAGLASREGVEVVGMEAAAVSYPGFTADLERLLSRGLTSSAGSGSGGSFARGCSPRRTQQAAIGPASTSGVTAAQRGAWRSGAARRRAPPRTGSRYSPPNQVSHAGSARQALPAVARERGRRASCAPAAIEQPVVARDVPARLDPALGVERAERRRARRANRPATASRQPRVGVEHAPVEVDAEAVRLGIA